jgi:hypothetical protein
MGRRANDDDDKLCNNLSVCMTFRRCEYTEGSLAVAVCELHHEGL